MKIFVTQVVSGNSYFEIANDGKLLSDSQEISNLLNLDVDVYIELLAKNVIKHNNYKTYNYNCTEKDILFKLNDIPKETYVERFKDAFTNQLTLLALGGESIEN